MNGMNGKKRREGDGQLGMTLSTCTKANRANRQASTLLLLCLLCVFLVCFSGTGPTNYTRTSANRPPNRHTTKINTLEGVREKGHEGSLGVEEDGESTERRGECSFHRLIKSELRLGMWYLEGQSRAGGKKVTLMGVLARTSERREREREGEREGKRVTDRESEREKERKRNARKREQREERREEGKERKNEKNDGRTGNSDGGSKSGRTRWCVNCQLVCIQPEPLSRLGQEQQRTKCVKIKTSVSTLLFLSLSIPLFSSLSLSNMYGPNIKRTTNGWKSDRLALLCGQ